MYASDHKSISIVSVSKIQVLESISIVSVSNFRPWKYQYRIGIEKNGIEGLCSKVMIFQKSVEAEIELVFRPGSGPPPIPSSVATHLALPVSCSDIRLIHIEISVIPKMQYNITNII